MRTCPRNPRLDFLDYLTEYAEGAELDKDNFWLHKFRLTFATRCLVDFFAQLLNEALK